jgi:hypothetical protein
MRRRLLAGVIGVAIAATTTELASWAALSLLQRGPAGFLFYHPPSLTQPEYEAYLATRDPELGWPAPRDLGGRRYDASGSRHVPAFPTPGNECVTLYGDSFTYSTDVDHVDAWGNVLATRLGCRVANFGVGAYGTDQAMLRFEANAADRAPVSILGFFVRDVLRNVSRYLQLDSTNLPTGFKPRFVADGGALRFLPIPRIDPAALDAFAAEPERFLQEETFLPDTRFGPVRVRPPFSITLARLVASDRVIAMLRGRPNWGDFLVPGHPSGGYEVTLGIMTRFHDDCRARGKRCLVLLFPAPSSLAHRARTGRSVLHDLMEGLSQHGIDYLDLEHGITRHLGSRPYEELLSGPNGHHYAEGDRVVATLVHEELQR